MPDTISLDDRFNYYGIDQAALDLVQAHRDQLDKAITSAIDAFYSFIRNHPLSADKFSNVNIEKLRDLQQSHWISLLFGQHDDRFLQESKAIGNVHLKVGVTPFLYVGGYNFVCKQLTTELMSDPSLEASQVCSLMTAVSGLIMMDMELALSAYVDASNSYKAAESANQFAESIVDNTITLSMSLNDVAIENSQMLLSLEATSEKATSIVVAVEEMATGISAIASNGQDVAESAEKAMSETHRGKQIMMDTSESIHKVSESVRHSVEKVQSLAEATAGINEMIKIIDNIASQTNLLALNATIEAARAGDAGKGFAVVAGEVKSLSSQTAKATEDIRQTIGRLNTETDAIVEAMHAGSAAAESSEQAMKGSLEVMDTINNMVELATQKTLEISSILEEQRSVSDELSKSTAEINSVTRRDFEALDSTIDATEKVVQLIGEQINMLANFDIRHKSVRIAKSDHIIWKKKLADMVAGRQSLDADELASHHNCRLGKWYYSEAGQHYGNTAVFKALEGPHKIVHEKGIEAVRQYNAGNRETAVKLLSDVEKASEDVVRLLDELIQKLD